MKTKLTLFVLLLPLLLLTGALIPNTVHASPTIVMLRPNAVGTRTEWSTVHGVTEHWDAVDEAASDEDATYIETHAPGDDTFNLPDIPIDAVVSSVTVYALAKSNPALAVDIRLIIIQNGIGVAGDWWGVPSGAYGPIHWELGTMTAAEVNGLEAGVGCGTMEEEWWFARVTQVYVEVEYTLPEVGVPELGLSIPIITSILTAVYLSVRQRLGRRRE